MPTGHMFVGKSPTLHPSPPPPTPSENVEAMPLEIIFYLGSDGSRVHIEKLHKRAARVITGSNNETRSLTEIFEK